MRIAIHPTSINLWLSARDTYTWANKPGARWPCSQLSGKRLFACFDKSGLCDITINGRTDTDCDANEFNAMTSDYLAERLPEAHPAWFIAVGQFRERS